MPKRPTSFSSQLPPVRDYVAYDPHREALGMDLHALDLSEWIEGDERLPHDLARKRTLLCEHRDEVLAALPAGDAGARETLRLLADHLPARYAQVGDHSPRASVARSGLPKCGMTTLPAMGRLDIDGRTDHAI